MKAQIKLTGQIKELAELIQHDGRQRDTLYYNLKGRARLALAKSAKNLKDNKRYYEYVPNVSLKCEYGTAEVVKS